jgi:hypothetical protein
MDRLWRSVAAKPQRDLWKRWTNWNCVDLDSDLGEFLWAFCFFAYGL